MATEYCAECGALNTDSTGHHFTHAYSAECAACRETAEGQVVAHIAMAFEGIDGPWTTELFESEATEGIYVYPTAGDCDRFGDAMSGLFGFAFTDSDLRRLARVAFELMSEAFPSCVK